MGLARTVVISRLEPAMLSALSPAGVDLDLDLTFLTQGRDPVSPATLLPQLALMARSSTRVFAYDVDGAGNVVVPGSALKDPMGYTLELYQRREAENPADPPVAIGLLAKGTLLLKGAAYGELSPLGPINIPVTVGPAGPVGPRGPQGFQGIQGEPGPANVLTVGGVTTGAPGSAAVAIITGVAPNQTISFVLPRGDVGAQGIQGIQGIQGGIGPMGPAGADSTVPGPVGPQGEPGEPNVLTVGTVTTGAPGSPAEVNITGASPDQTISFVIPEGETGDTGPQGIQGGVGPMGPPGADSTVPGPVGPMGPAGADSTVPGPQGPQGDPGLDAINLLSGTVDPAAGTGVVGDFYVNLTTGSLFGPKAATGTIWPVVKLTTYWS
ncbi:hypothetical protein NKG99_20365 [Mesorhizobium sp. M1409]|uniref:hypothetical protein n=1 Tax=Mesorhizobium sp. M1409 TaxID=2957100 RepID=UPI00333C0606